MKQLQSTPRKIICENPQSLFGYFGWPSVVRLPDGTLAMGSSGFRIGHICPFGKVTINYSRDEGETWTAPAAVIDTPLDDRDCGLAVFGKNKNRVIVTSFNNTPDMQKYFNDLRLEQDRKQKENSVASHEINVLEYKSDLDEKHTANLLVDAYVAYQKTQNWEQYLGSTYKISEDGGYTFGDLKLVPVSAPHGPCPLNDGGLLYVGRVFETKEDRDRTDEVQAWKLNENDEWEFVSQIESASDEYGSFLNCEPHAIQLPSGRIITHIRSDRDSSNPEEWAFSVYQSISDDNGKTWTKPARLMGQNDGSPPHLMLHSSGALICAYGRRKAPYGIRVMFSYDEGETWDTDYILYNDAASPDLGYPATVELKDGRLLTVWYENIGGRSVIAQKIWELPKK